MVLVKVDAVVVLATSISVTSGVLPVLANAAMAVAHLATKLPGLLLAG